MQDWTLKELKGCIGNECCDNCKKIMKKGRGISLDVWGFKKEPITLVLAFCSEKCFEEYKEKEKKE